MYSNLTSTTWYGLGKQITASALIATGAGVVTGIIVSSHTNGTVKLWNSLTATGTVAMDTYTYGVGSQTIPLFGIRFNTGLFVDMNSTVQNIVVVINQ